jgi:NTE family protein
MKLGLALSGGTLKAAAHIGVLKALQELNIKPDMVAGTSAGGLVAALYTHGYKINDFLKIIDHFSPEKLMDYGFPVMSSLYTVLHRRLAKQSSLLRVYPHGFIRGLKLQRYICDLLQNRICEKPLLVISTDLLTGNPIVFAVNRDAHGKFTPISSKDLPTAILGSSALPGIFTPVSYPPYLLVDGAMRHYVPVEALRQCGCTKIIAVNLYQLPRDYSPKTTVDVLARSFDILLRESIDNDTQQQDVFVLEPRFTSASVWSLRDMKQHVHRGEVAVAEVLPKLQQFLSSRTHVDASPRDSGEHRF